MSTKQAQRTQAASYDLMEAVLQTHLVDRGHFRESEERLRLLVDTGIMLAGERSLDAIAQRSADVGRRLSGASAVAFFYVKRRQDGECCQLGRVAGVKIAMRDGFSIFSEGVFDSAGGGPGVRRIGDLASDGAAGVATAFLGTEVRNYLAVPVVGRGGEVFGGVFCGHAEPNWFSSEEEDLIAALALQAGAAMAQAMAAEAASREMAETMSRFQQALNAGNQGTWSWDRETDLLDFDTRGAELFGVSTREAVRRGALRQRVLHPEDAGQMPEDLQDRIDERGIYSAEFRIVQPDGAVRWVAESGTAKPGAGGKGVARMSGTVQDITARKMQEAALLQSEKLAATGRLAATIAHEINNPLEAVTNLIYLCKTDPSVPAAARQMLEIADGELARVSQIAQQTLGFYRDTGCPSEFDVAELLTGVRELFSRKLVSKRVTCRLELGPGLRAFGLAGEIKQVFSNLIVNALDASQADTKLLIRARRVARGEQKGISVLVSDQGSGVAPSVRERLFTPFFTTKPVTGTGLGLWVTRRIVEKHGGIIRFRSRTAQPSGTVFQVFLPAGVENGEESGSPESRFLQ